MIRYGQYCPVAKALELLAERWTLLVVRELLMGGRRFNDLRRGLPLIAPSVLSQRLKALEAHQIVLRRAQAPGSIYTLTAAGEELRPLIMQLGTWGQRWSRSRMEAHDLDASFLMWDIRRNIRHEQLPQRAVIRFEFPDARQGMRHWWLLVSADDVDLCLQDPGHEVDVSITASLRTMTQIWMGDIALRRARARGEVRVHGKTQLIRTLDAWLGRSPFADVTPGMLDQREQASSRAPASSIVAHAAASS